MSIPTSPWATSGTARSLGDHLRPAAPERERTGEAPDVAWKRLSDADVTDALIDPAAGGKGISLAQAVADVADIAAGDLVGALLLAGHHASVATLRSAGSPTLGLQERIRRERRRLSPALRGGGVLSIAPRAGGQAALEGVAGEVHGAGAALGFVAVAADPDGAPWAAFVPADRPGVVVEDLALRAGLRRLPAGRAQFLGARLEQGESVAFPSGQADPQALARGLRALFDAAAATGAARGSVEAVASLTRARKHPRPVPGATSPITDPIGQAVIGGALGPIDGAHALVTTVAGEFDGALAGGAGAARGGADELLLRALAALDTALAVALTQGEEVYELAGTSGSGNVHGLDALWRDVRTLSLTWPRGERRRALGHAFLAGGR